MTEVNLETIVAALTPYSTTTTSVSSLMPASVEDEGGQELFILGTFKIDPCTVSVVVGSDLIPCYSGNSGEGYSPIPLGGNVLRVVVPPLPIGGPYTVRVVQDGTTVNLTTSLEVVARVWRTKVFDLRALLPHFWALGAPRTLPTTPLLESGVTLTAPSVFEVLTRAVGGIANELGGERFTRATSTTAAGATTLPVESTYEWPSTGFFRVGGELHAYSGITATSFTGVSHDVEGVDTAGLVAQVLERDEVLDVSRSFSDIDLLRRGFFVDTATGDDLSVLGRNLGVDRPPSLTDDEKFRLVVKAVAYARKGTENAIRNALTVFFGEGNYELWEEPDQNPGKVFIRILSGPGAIGSQAEGRFFLNKTESALYDDSANEVVITEAPVTKGGVSSVTLRDSTFDEILSALPSTFNEVRFDGDVGVKYWGFDDLGSGAAEGVEVTASAVIFSGSTQFDYSAGSYGVFEHLPRVVEESTGVFSNLVRFNNLTNDAGEPNWEMSIFDGARQYRLGVLEDGSGDGTVSFLDATDTPIGTVTFSAAAGTFYEFEIRKRPDGRVQWSVDGHVQEVLERSDFEASAEQKVQFGTVATGESPTYNVRHVGFFFHTTTDYANARGTTGEVDTSAPTEFNTSSSLIVVGDVGKSFRVSGSGITNAEGGNNNGTWQIATRIDASVVTLTGFTRKLGLLQSSRPATFTAGGNPEAFLYPDNAGHTLEILTGSHAGDFQIIFVVDPITGRPFQAGDYGTSDRVQVVGAATGDSGSAGIVTSGSEVFTDNTGLFTAGDVGNSIAIRSGLNVGIFQITEFLTTKTVKVNANGLGQPFVTESSIAWELYSGPAFSTEIGVDYRVKPVFETETGLAWEFYALTGTTTDTLVLRQDPPFTYSGFVLVLDVTYSPVLSGQLLPNETVDNAQVALSDPAEFDYYPAYIPDDGLGAFRQFIEDLTAAGIIPVVVA